MSVQRLHWADYVVTVLTLMVALGIGVFFAVFRGGQRSKVEYLLGSRQVSLVPVCLSLFVTFQSAIGLMGVPVDCYNTGTMIVYFGPGFALAYLTGCVTVVPLFYPLHLTSVYQYLHLRFGSSAVRLLGTAIGMTQTVLYMGLSLFSPALALQTAAGLPFWVSVVIVGGIGTSYTAIGGIKSVVWTDAFQTVIVFMGISAVLIKGTAAVGGFKSMVDITNQGGRVQFDDVNPDPRVRHSLWAVFIGGCFTSMVNCFNQSTVQRIGSLPTLKAAKMIFLLNAPINILYVTSLTVTGMVLYSYMVTIGCDFYQAGLVTNKNQLMPYFVMHVLSDLPGFSGLYMSMLFSGALSTVSSGINALTANTVEDLLSRPLRSVPDSTVTFIAKMLTAVYGCIAIGLAYLMQSLDGPVTQIALTVFGACGGPVAGMFMLGGSMPRANKYGAMGGGIIGLAITLWVAVGSRLYSSPTVSLPPGPVDNCTDVNATSWSLSHHGSDVTASLNSTWGPQWSDPGMTSPVMVNNLTAQPLDTADRLDRPFAMYDISYLWIAALGLFSAYLPGILISYLTGSLDAGTQDVRLIFPFCRRLHGMPDHCLSPEDASNVIATKKLEMNFDVIKVREDHKARSASDDTEAVKEDLL